MKNLTVAFLICVVPAMIIPITRGIILTAFGF